MNAILQKLTGGDRRSIGRVDEVVAEVLSNPDLFDVLFQGMLSDDLLLRMRCADAVEKISIQHPEYLQPYKRQLIKQVAPIDQQEIRWHVAQMVSRLELTADERSRVFSILMVYLQDKSKIVKTFAMQALADLAADDPQLRPQIVNLLEEHTRTGSPAMKSRGRKLLERLNYEEWDKL
jgi:hypothetical protein